MEFRLTGMRSQVEEILPGVRKPARYTGGELGEVKKDHASVGVLFALAFPDVYEVGMSNVGLKILYHTLNRREDTAAERTFAPAQDMEREMRQAGIPLYAIESFTPISDFDIVGFSLSYELNYTNVLNMLDLSGIPLRSSDRNESHPLIIAGGHCTFNPEPIAEFVDAFVIGEGEEVAHKIVNVYKEHKACRQHLLRELTRIEGVYVPTNDVPSKVSRAIVRDIEHSDYPESMIVPFIETIHDRATLEIMRGCTRGCRFCQAGMITRPVRERSNALLMRQAEAVISNTGYDEIGLMSLSSADHTGIEPLVSDLINRYEPEKVGISLPSIRADAGCVRFAAQIQRVRKTGLTFAPEAGTQRLRDAINKNVTESDLLEAVDIAISCGWRKIKLYFMIGLPTETEEDVEAIADLVHKVQRLARERRKPLTVNISISAFIPKPHTPFQWRAQDKPEEIERKIGILKDRLRGRSISFSWHDPVMSKLEAVMARGGRELGPAILRAWETGARFDGWDDSFDPAIWRRAFEETGVDADAIAHNHREYHEPLPWDHIDCGISKIWLEAQDRLADEARTSVDCRLGGSCLNCGIKEFLKSTDCGMHKQVESHETSEITAERIQLADKSERVWYRLIFSKDKNVRWLGHLDLVRTLERAVRRAHVPVAYSQGFNPRPRMSFYSQLSVGMTGEAEPMTIELTKHVDCNELVSALNSALPNGISIISAAEVAGRHIMPINGGEYLIGVSCVCNGDLGKAIRELLTADSAVVERKKDNDIKHVDVRPGIESLEIIPGAEYKDCTGILKTRLVSVRPVELMDALKSMVPSLEQRFIHRIRVY